MLFDTGTAGAGGPEAYKSPKISTTEPRFVALVGGLETFVEVDVVGAEKLNGSADATGFDDPPKFDPPPKSSAQFDVLLFVVLFTVGPEGVEPKLKGSEGTGAGAGATGTVLLLVP